MKKKNKQKRQQPHSLPRINVLAERKRCAKLVCYYCSQAIPLFQAGQYDPGWSSLSDIKKAQSPWLHQIVEDGEVFHEYCRAAGIWDFIAGYKTSPPIEDSWVIPIPETSNA